MEFKADVVVLGAGMVGVSAALHLQQRGRDEFFAEYHIQVCSPVRDYRFN